MPETVASIGLFLLAGLLAFFGASFLALSQDRNVHRVLGRSVQDKRVSMMRTTGWLLVFVSLIPCIARDGGSFAALLWPLLLAAASIATAMLLAYRPQWLTPIAKVGWKNHIGA
ncbi:MAG: DUF3325 domain-containing protein [Sphingomonadales bacterium]